MKKTFFTMALAIACMSCVEAQHTLTVKLSDITNDTVNVLVINKEINGFETQDKIVPQNGEFSYDFKGDKARLAMLKMNTAQGPARLQIFLVPGEQGTLTGTTKEAKWSGTRFYSELADSIDKLEDPEAIMNLIPADMKNGVFSDICAAMQVQIDREKARKEAAKFVADGCEAPDFTLDDINGKPLSLKSLRGKYLILDFWGSWCGWCIKGMPDMKKAYAKYNSKLEILGVDCNDTPEKWKAAVKNNELPWKHVYCPRNSDITKKYAIQGFPTKIIIDPQGKIVKTVIGEDPAFYTTLDELMK